MASYYYGVNSSILMSGFILLFSTTLLLSDLPSISVSALAIDCTPGPGYECYYAQNVYYSNRKMVTGLGGGMSGPKYGAEAEAEAELRDVPSGPDPLHHSGAPQKRPRITP